MSEILSWQADHPLDQEIIGRVTRSLGDGELLVYPTSNLYGLGASIRSETGLDALRKAKQRPGDMPLSVMATKQQISELCTVTELANVFIENGDMSITAVLPASGKVPSSMVHHGTLAVRLPCSELCDSLVRAAGPITATSANVHGNDAPVTVREAESQLGDLVALYLDAGTLTGTPTTLVDLTGTSPKILREGLATALEVMTTYEG